ncbi:MAG: hypothetical protein ACPGUI_00385 [Halarcobacter sp.]
MVAKIKDEREKRIDNGIAKFGSIEDYIKSLSSNTVKNYKALLMKRIEKDTRSQVISKVEAKELTELITKLLNNELIDEDIHELHKDLQKNYQLIENQTSIEPSRANILLISFFSSYPLNLIKTIKINDVHYEDNTEWIIVKVDGQNTQFAVTQHKELFIALIEHIKKSPNTYLVESINNIDYEYFSKNANKYFNRNLCEGGIRVIKKTFKDLEIVTPI